MEWYWNIELPSHFICDHSVRTVLERAKYGDYFCALQGVTAGATFQGMEYIWPVLETMSQCTQMHQLLEDVGLEIT